jgi:Xaa-Pro dipeptidase
MEEAALHNLYLQHVGALQHAAETLLAAHHLDALVIHSGRAAKKSLFDDQYWPLRVTPHFLHWAPLELADCAVIVRPGRRPALVYNVARDYWDGAPDVDPLVLEAFEVLEVTDPEVARTLIPSGSVAFVGDDLERAAAWGLGGAANPKGIVDGLDRRRTLKTRYELGCLAEANRLAAAGHAAVRDAFHGGDVSELDLHLRFLGATAQDDAETPYKNIVAFDAHAATLHHVHYGRRAVAAKSLLLDAGAEFRGYAADITRTYVKDAAASATATAFAALIAGVERLQQATCRQVQVGMKYEALHDHAHQLLAGVLREVGLVDASDDELVASGVTRLFLPHGLGHSLGVQVHDVGCASDKPRADNPFLRNTSVIEADQVFTIEPGCYFIDEKLALLEGSTLAGRVRWPLVRALKDFGGVRIEDDVVVRAQGIDNLTRTVLPR